MMDDSGIEVSNKSVSNDDIDEINMMMNDNNGLDDAYDDIDVDNQPSINDICFANIDDNTYGSKYDNNIQILKNIDDHTNNIIQSPRFNSNMNRRSSSIGRRSSIIQVSTPSRLTRLKSMDRSIYDDSVDSIDNTIHINMIKLSLSIDNIFIRAVSIRSIAVINVMKSMSIQHKAHRYNMTDRIDKLKDMKCIKLFMEKVRVLPRRSLLRWKIFSDDKFISSHILKIALNSRINHMIAIIRFKYIANKKNMDSHIIHRRYSLGIQRLMVIYDNMRDKDRYDRQVLYEYGYNRIKDRYHRMNKMKILFNMIDSILYRRSHRYSMMESMHNDSMHRYTTIQSIYRCMYSKMYTCMNTMRYDASTCDDSSIDIYKSIQYIEHSIHTSIHTIIHRDDSMHRGIYMLHKYVDRRMHGYSSVLYNHIYSYSIHHTRIYDILYRLMYNVYRYTFNRLHTIYIHSIRTRIHDTISRIYDIYNNKMYVSYITLCNTPVSYNNRMYMYTILDNISNNNKRYAINKMYIMVKNVKMKVYMRYISKWYKSTYRPHINIRTLHACIHLYDTYRSLHSRHMIHAIRRMRYDGVHIRYIDDRHMYVSYINTIINRHIYRISFDHILSHIYTSHISSYHTYNTYPSLLY